MDQDELCRRLETILEAEERKDWGRVKQLSEDLKRALAGQRLIYPPEIVDHYLANADIREQDDQYGERQRSELRRFVDTGEHEEGTTVPPWSCGIVVALLIAAVIWLVT